MEIWEKLVSKVPLWLEVDRKVLQLIKNRNTFTVECRCVNLTRVFLPTMGSRLFRTRITIFTYRIDLCMKIDTKVYSTILLVLGSKNDFIFFTTILPDYVTHESQIEFWKNSHFENTRAGFLLRCQNTLRQNDAFSGMEKSRL